MPDVEAVEDHPDYIIIKDLETGKETKAFKINIDGIQKRHMEDIEKIAKSFSKEQLIDLIQHLESILNKVPTVDEYQEVAANLEIELEACYTIVGNSNLFHHPIKNISLNCYGKAYTFTKEVKGVLDNMYEVAEFMLAMGKIKRYNTVHLPYIDYMFAISDLPEMDEEEQQKLDLLQNEFDGSKSVNHHWVLKTEIS